MDIFGQQEEDEQKGSGDENDCTVVKEELIDRSLGLCSFVESCCTC
jgi:hypothetical protein